MPPVPAAVSTFLEWLQRKERYFRLDANTPPLYERRRDDRFAFDWVPIRSTPTTSAEGDGSSLGEQAMVGGPRIAKVL